MASILKVDDLRGNTAAGNITITSEGGSATMQLQQGVAKAWWNLNGTGTIAERDSFNVSSHDDAGTGLYDANYTSAMADGNYAFQGTTGVASNTALVFAYHSSSVPSTADIRYGCEISNNITLQDQSYVFGTIYGDLA